VGGGGGPDLSILSGQLEELAHLHAELADESSRRLLIELLAYRILGDRHVVLPLGIGKEFASLAASAEGLVSKRPDTIALPSLGWDLRLFDLAPIGFDIRLFTYNPVIPFVIREYEYRADGNVVRAEEGDVVLDCGACWGDTALYFASQTHAPVYSFEFLPSNLTIFRRNVELNPKLAPFVKLVDAPVWSESDREMYVQDRGPATRVSPDPIPDAQRVKTLSIDDLVERERIPRVGFIKMDIEGAELDALNGARKTLERDRPKLAICVYHRRDDLVQIPRFLRSLPGKYRVYLAHFTMHAEETVLFAQPV
jgi:FkbM family methyltransferase